jgi:hypothetical protein
MKKQQLFLLGGLLLVLMLLGGFLLLQPKKQERLRPVTTVTPGAAVIERPTVATGNIIIAAPQAGQKVSLPITLRGEARVFENQFQYRVRNGSSGTILFEHSAYANSPDTGQYGPFQISISSLPEEAEKNLILEAFDYSAKDGAEIDTVRVPVVFDPANTMTVKAYFLSRNAPAGQECTTTYPVVRRIKKTQATARAALEEVLKGPMMIEKERGLLTNINEGVTIQKLTIEHGMANVDLSEQLGEHVGGSCRVSSIRRQITDTLKQFPTVSDVTISINGRTDDILQP